MLKLDAQKFEETIGQLKKGFNQDVLESVGKVAAVLKDDIGENPIIAQTVDQCKKFQASYNVALEGVDKVIGEFGKVFDITEYLEKRATVGELSSRDTSFSTSNIDPSTVQGF